MIKLEYDAAPAINALTQLEGELNDKQNLWERLQQNVVDVFIQELWDTRGYGQWFNADGSPRTLYDTGRLFESFSYGPDHIEQETMYSFLIGTTVEYAVFYEDEILGLLENNPLFISELERETQVWVDGIVRKVF